MAGLIKGELLLTLNLALGLLLGEVITRLKLPEKLLRSIASRLRVNAVTALATATSIGSSKAGAAILSGAYAHGEITERCAVWSVLMLSLPAYIRRWPSTLILSVSMAGRAGMIYASVMLMIAVLRFMLAYRIVVSEGKSSVQREGAAAPAKTKAPSLREAGVKALKLLPAAWIFYGLAYMLVPMVNTYMKGIFSGGILPLAGWTVAASAIMRVKAALALAGGGIASGELGVNEAVFSLLLGSGLGTLTRILRMNGGYYFGLFPMGTARKMLLMNYASIAPLVIVSILAAYICL